MLKGDRVSDIDKTWSSWTDILGNTIYPGDYIAVATINGRSPQQVICQVERINRLNSRGEEITEGVRDQGHWKNVPSCSITARPIMDARNFMRWSTWKGNSNAKDKPRAVTYQIPANCIKIPAPVVPVILHVSSREELEQIRLVKLEEDSE